MNSKKIYSLLKEYNERSDNLIEKQRQDIEKTFTLFGTFLKSEPVKEALGKKEGEFSDLEKEIIKFASEIITIYDFPSMFSEHIEIKKSYKKLLDEIVRSLD